MHEQCCDGQLAHEHFSNFICALYQDYMGILTKGLLGSIIGRVLIMAGLRNAGAACRAAGNRGPRHSWSAPEQKTCCHFVRPLNGSR